MRTGLRRIAAWLIDGACILAWVAVTAAVGVPLALSGAVRLVDPIAQNAVAALVVVVPVVLAAAVLESRGGATPGKRALRLHVEHGATPPRFGRALLRNALKIGLPWLIAHAAVFAVADAGAAGQPTPSGAWVLLLAAYVLPIAWVVSLFIGRGRTPYDRLAGTVVA
jgi:uncharacterized RDD family membrane protein YckC